MMLACHAGDPGSIPGGCIFLFLGKDTSFFVAGSVPPLVAAWLGAAPAAPGRAPPELPFVVKWCSVVLLATETVTLE